MMRYNLRPITVRDAVGFCDVFNTVSIESGFLVNGPLDKGYVPEVVEKSISHWIEESDVCSNYVLDIEGDIVGVMSVSPESMYLHKIKHSFLTGEPPSFVTLSLACTQDIVYYRFQSAI